MHLRRVRQTPRRRTPRSLAGTGSALERASVTCAGVDFALPPHRKSLRRVIVMVVIVLGVGAAAFFAGRASRKPTAPAPSTTTSTTPSAAATTTPSSTPSALTSASCGQIGYYQEGTETSAEPGYVVTITNTASSTIKVSGWVVTFNQSGQQTGSDSEGPNGLAQTVAYIEPDQAFSWTVTPGNGPWTDGQFSGDLTVSPNTTCSVVTVSAATA